MLAPPTSKWGFTLIELLVVLAIVAMLLTLVAPRYTKQLESSKEVVLIDNLRSTRQVLDQYYTDTGRYPESLEDLVEKRYLRALPVDPITESVTTWRVIGVPTGFKGNVYDIKSGATGAGRNGKAYADW